MLTVSGSLRKASLNAAMLAMAGECAPSGLVVESRCDLAEVPPFNPDLPWNRLPAVARLWREIDAVDAVLFASPEYAHGVSGVLKNALDWMVESGVFVDKPVVLWNASPRASIALAALRETLSVMSARPIDEAGLTMLIKSSDVADKPFNPDPVGMLDALLALHKALALREVAADRTNFRQPS